MNKVEVGTLDENELFEHRGVQDGLLCPLPNPNDKYRYRDKWKYLYTEFSLWTKVNKLSTTHKSLV